MNDDIKKFLSLVGLLVIVTMTLAMAVSAVVSY